MSNVIAYRWDTVRDGRHTSNIWCPDCNEEFQQCGNADADLTAEDITPGQTCDVCGRDILTGRPPEDQQSTA